MKGILKLTIKDDSCQFDLGHMFNNLSMMMVNSPPFSQPEDKPFEKQNMINININISGADKDQKFEPKQHQYVDSNLRILDLLSDSNTLEKSLKFLNTTIKDPSKSNGNDERKNQIKKTYLRPTQFSQQEQKIFWMVRDQYKEILKLNCPKFVVALPNDYLLAIQRKCISLYQIDGMAIDLKDYDSVGLGKKMTVSEVKPFVYDSITYVGIFVNEKASTNTFFRVLIYKIVDSNLQFVKKATLANKQISSPAVLFDSYPKHENEKFCLILGGYTDNRDTYIYGALQVNLYLLVEKFVEIQDINITKVDFSSRTPIIGGKAIQFNDYWYVFSSQYQHIIQLKLRYEQGGILNSIETKSQNLGFMEKIYFNEDNLSLGFKGKQHMIVMLNKNIQFRYKTFEQIRKKFKYH